MEDNVPFMYSIPLIVTQEAMVAAADGIDVVLPEYIGFSTPKGLISPIWVFLFRLQFRKVGSVTFTRVCSYQPVNHYRSSPCELDMLASLFLLVKSAFLLSVLFAYIRLMIRWEFYWKHGGHRHATYQCLQSPSKRGIRHGLSGSEYNIGQCNNDCYMCVFEGGNTLYKRCRKYVWKCH